MKTSINRMAGIAIFAAIGILIFQINLAPRVFSSKTRLLIFDFQPIGVPENEARIITELISAKIVKHNVFTVIDRTHIDSILKEHELHKSGFTTHEERMKLGKMLNSEKLMYGSVSRMNGTYYVIIKIIDIVKGTIEWSDAVKIKDIYMIDQHIALYLEKIVRDDNIDGDLFMRDKKPEGSGSNITPYKELMNSMAPKNQEDNKKIKSSWYIGFGYGPGNGRVNYSNGEKTSIKKFNSDRNDNSRSEYDTTLAINFGIGWILSQEIHFGFDLSLINTNAKKYDSNGTKKADDLIQITNYLPLVTYFPFSKGIFFRGGAGLSDFTRETYTATEQININSTGIAMLAGVGFALKANKTFNICVHLDYSKQYYSNHVKRSDFWSIYVSVYWF